MIDQYMKGRAIVTSLRTVKPKYIYYEFMIFSHSGCIYGPQKIHHTIAIYQEVNNSFLCETGPRIAHESYTQLFSLTLPFKQQLSTIFKIPTNNYPLVRNTINIYDNINILVRNICCSLSNHYRNSGLCRVPAALPSAFYRALGKEDFAESRTRQSPALGKELVYRVRDTRQILLCRVANTRQRRRSAKSR
jgi:hypothetical protein